jgi:hypothetical protein
LAAAVAFDLLNDYGVTPTLTRGRPYLKFTAFLVEAATDRCVGDDAIERACRWHMAQLRADGFPTTAELRRLRKEFAKLPVPEWEAAQLQKKSRRSAAD